MKFSIKKQGTYFLCGLFAMLIAVDSFGQNLSGIVQSATGEKIANASILLQPIEINSISKNDGSFIFSKLNKGKYLLLVSCVGYADYHQDVVIDGADVSVAVTIQQRIVGLKDVTVVAKPLRIGTSSKISKTAIEHTQPVSLLDALQLIPGQLAANPNLGVAQQINLRQVPSTTEAQRANALGTQVLLDGIPQSNNANLQTNLTILNSAPSALPPFSSVAGRGNDLRQIPADNIESIEVIRGIPSARFGDLTSGLVLVQSRIGAFRPEIRFRANPNLLQGAIMHGFQSGSKQNTINTSLDVLQSRDDIRDIQNRYTRVQGQLAWQKFWSSDKKFVTTTIVNGHTTIDKLRQDPGDLRSQRKIFSEDQLMRLSTDGKWNAGKPWLHHLNYLVSYTKAKQESYFQEIVTRDLFPVSDALVDTTKVGVFGRSEYLNRTTINGRPENGYARLEGAILKKTGGFTHCVLLGAEWRMDVNNGTGRQFNVLEPPRQNYSVGERLRSYRDIPAQHQLGYYIENKTTGRIGNKRIIGQLGMRIDNVAPIGVFKSKYKTIVSPRINVAAEVASGVWLRGGYGIAAKAVPINYMYPGQRFFDLVNFNYFAINPAERLVVITTRVIDLDGQSINPFTSKKFEVGADIERKQFNINFSLFSETTTGAVGFNRLVRPFTYNRLQATSTPQGVPPVLNPQPLLVDTFFAAYDVPVNNRKIINTGLEYNIDLPEIKSINTSFNINGAYIRTQSFDDGEWYDADRAYSGNIAPTRIGIYQSAANITASRFNTSVRFISRIPKLNVLFSALWQTVWVSITSNAQLDSLPIGFVNRQGNITRLSPTDAKQAQYLDLNRRVNPSTKNRFPPLHLINVRFTKQWKKGFGFSFYVNNFLSSRPLHTEDVTATKVRRNEPLFFGAELTIRL